MEVCVSQDFVHLSPGKGSSEIISNGLCLLFQGPGHNLLIGQLLCQDNDGGTHLQMT